MSQPKITEMEIDGMKVICVGEPDFTKIPEEKLERFVDFCMDSLDRYFKAKEEAMNKASNA